MRDNTHIAVRMTGGYESRWTSRFSGLRQRKCWYYYLLVFLFLLSFSLRVYRLDAFDLWGDEAWSVKIASWSLAQILSSTAETNPPLYQILLHFMMQLAGDSPFALRFLSAALAQVAMAFVALFGKTIHSRSLGMAALALGAISPFLVYYAHEARMYGPALVGVSGSLAAFAWIVRGQLTDRAPKRRVWLLYVICSLIGVFSHYYAFSVLLGEAAFVSVWLMRTKAYTRLRRWLATWLVMALIFVPWPLIHLSFLGGKANARFEEWSFSAFTMIVRRTLSAFAAGVTQYPAEQWQSWLVVAMALLGLTMLISRGRGRAAGWLSLAVLFSGYLFAWVASPFMPFFYERYLLVGMPAFLILLAGGVLALRRIWRPGALLAATAILLVSGRSLRNQFFEPAFDQGGYGRLMAEIEGKARQGDLMLLVSPQPEPLFDYYGTEQLPAVYLEQEVLASAIETASWMAAKTDGYDRIWLLETGNSGGFDPERRAQTWLGENGSRGFYQSYGNGNILHLFALPPVGEVVYQPFRSGLGQDILLTGYDFRPASVGAGETLYVSLRWQAKAPIEHGYTVFVHLLDEDGILRAQIDGQPAGGARPTSSWVQGEMIEDRHAILLPADLVGGTYTVRVGMYLWPELTRLTVNGTDALVVDDSVSLGTVSIR
jgi:hypothetical protein